MSEAALEITGSEIVVVTPSLPALRRVGKAPRPRPRMQWRALLGLMPLLIWVAWANRDGLPDLQGVSAVHLAPAGVLVLLFLILMFSGLFTRSVTVFDQQGIRLYQSLGGKRILFGSYKWRDLKHLEIGEDALVMRIQMGVTDPNTLIGAGLTADQKLQAFNAIRALAARADYEIPTAAHA